jgi:hypothetical protein
MFNEKIRNTKTFTYTVLDSEENAVDLVNPVFTIYDSSQNTLSV